MAVYKVPQDVEADDKLLGPFSFRQFIYLIITALGVGMAWLLAQIFIGLIIIPAPVIIFFGALALPIKKDQPMEAYLGAMISFYFIKPRKRLWVPDGLNALVQITAPRNVEPDRAKDITGDEAKERLGYLTDIVESRGWSVRGSGVPMPGSTAVNNAYVQETEAIVDMFDDSDREGRKFDQLIQERREITVNELNSRMQAEQPAQPTPSAVAPPLPPVAPSQTSQQPPQAPADPRLQYNPYPQNIRQSVVQPLSAEHYTAMPAPRQQPQAAPPTAVQTPIAPAAQPPMAPIAVQEEQSTSETPPSPDIIKLANESDGLTVADVAHQAHRIAEKHGLPEEEVQISLH